jgi:hypothetical protein
MRRERVVRNELRSVGCWRVWEAFLRVRLWESLALSLIGGSRHIHRASSPSSYNATAALLQPHTHVPEPRRSRRGAAEHARHLASHLAIACRHARHSRLAARPGAPQHAHHACGAGGASGRAGGMAGSTQGRRFGLAPRGRPQQCLSSASAVQCLSSASAEQRLSSATPRQCLSPARAPPQPPPVILAPCSWGSRPARAALARSSSTNATSASVPADARPHAL